MILLITYLFVALFFSFLCSILEAVILSTTPSFIEIKIEQNKRYAKDLKKLKENIDKPLAAILTLNTFAHTVGAAGVGAQAQIIWGSEYLSLISIILTLLILFFSEIIPKTLGATYWKQLAPFAASILELLIFILYPFVVISNFLTKLIGKKEDSIITRDDFSVLATIGSKSGVFDKEESQIIKNLIEFKKIFIKDIMTPRTVVTSADEELLINEFYKNNKNLQFSRLPLYKDQSDNITGFCLKDDILAAIIENRGNEKLRSLKREILIVFEMTPVHKLLKTMIEQGEQIALVINEYGGMEGVVTIEDFVETLLGLEIVDETDIHEDMQQLAREVWEKKGESKRE